LIVIFSTSGALEAVATKRTADGVRALLHLAPERATRLTSDGLEEAVDTADLVVGDVVVVRPGQRIGADATVIEGRSEVDQSSITGEPLPVVKGPGHEVFAGTLNGRGSLRARVDRPAAESVVARIVRLVEQASATKARTQLFIERVEQRYSVTVVVSTLALFVSPLLMGSGLRPTLLRAMTFMIVASPCAVVLATMPPLLAAMANASRHGVLVKSAVVMEQLGLTAVVAFDKTGTLTEGAPQLVEIRPGPGQDQARLLSLAAAAEQPSEHPLGRAVAAAARHRGLAVPEAVAFASVPGVGVSAIVDGLVVQVANTTVLDDRMPDWSGPIDAGYTAVLVIVEGVPAGVLLFADQLRQGAAGAVTALRSLTGRTPILLTGDHPAPAGRVAAAVGVSEVYAALLPEGKVTAVQGLQADGARVLLVGDGVNDAPALAAANLGVAMGRRGADLALETADAVIVRDELSTLPAMIGLSRRARRLVTQNLIIASLAIAVLVGWDLVGHLPLPIGVAGHEGSTVLVGLNGLRLLRPSAWRGTDTR
jgi:heavy metal translocating P-type ATPase